MSLLETDFAMKKQIMLNVNMMVEIVVQILTWLVMPDVMMKQTRLSVIMMVETVADLLFPVSIYISLIYF